jgi:hypothetical protein
MTWYGKNLKRGTYFLGIEKSFDGGRGVGICQPYTKIFFSFFILFGVVSPYLSGTSPLRPVHSR